jgi:hypothetical protein
MGELCRWFCVLSSSYSELALQTEMLVFRRHLNVLRRNPAALGKTQIPNREADTFLVDFCGAYGALMRRPNSSWILLLGPLPVTRAP